MTIGFGKLKVMARRAAGLAVAITLVTTASALAGKDLGPSGGCDALAKGSPAWNDCVGPVG